MTAIRVIFDGKAFIPQQAVSLPSQFEAIVLVESTDAVALAKLDQEVRAYYQAGIDSDDESWGRAASQESQCAWDED